MLLQKSFYEEGKEKLKVNFEGYIEASLGPCQKPKMKRFVKIVNGSQNTPS